MIWSGFMTSQHHLTTTCSMSGTRYIINTGVNLSYRLMIIIIRLCMLLCTRILKDASLALGKRCDAPKIYDICHDANFVFTGDTGSCHHNSEWCVCVCNTDQCKTATNTHHYSDVIMRAMMSQITGVSIVCSTVCSGADQRTLQSSASLAFVRGVQRWPMDSPHKGPATRKMFPFDDVIIHPYT